MPLKGGLDRFLSRLQTRNALNFRILPRIYLESRLPRGSKFCACPCYMVMRVSQWPVPVAELCLRVSLFCCPCHISMRVSLWPVPIVELCLRVSLFCHCPRYMTIWVCLRSLLVADPLSGKPPLPRGMAVRQSQLRGIVDSCNILLAVPENCPEKRCSLPEGT